MYKKLSGFVLAFLMIFTVACSAPEKKVVIASKPFAESYILAEMLALLVENHTDIEVERKLGIGGGTGNIHPAMINGEIDMYPEYTGTSHLFVLKEDIINDPDELYQNVIEKYQEQYNLTWLGLYGFNNTYAMIVKESLAEEMDLNDYDDLAAVSDQLVFGAEYDFFEREDGYEGLKSVYPFNFRDTKEMDIGLKYEALDSDEVDVINAFSTDGLLNQYDLRVLEDNENFFPAYQAGTIVRSEVLEQYPELEEVLNMLEGQISEDEMIEMNYFVESENRDAKEVAEEFLKAKDLIE